MLKLEFYFDAQTSVDIIILTCHHNSLLEFVEDYLFIPECNTYLSVTSSVS